MGMGNIWSDGFIEANGIRLHFLRTGGDKPALIALHGLMGDGACWTPVARALAPHFDVVLLDARGHGSSSSPRQGYLYEDHVGDVVAVIDGLGLNRPYLLGHSMGGMTAAFTAAKLGDAVRGVILADPTFISREWQLEIHESDIAEQQRAFAASDRADLLADAQRRHPRRSLELIELVTDARLKMDMAAIEVLTPPNPDFREVVATISAPILLILGSAGVVSEDTARELKSINPNLRYHMVPDVGHGLPYDRPDILSEKIQSFSRNGNTLE